MCIERNSNSIQNLIVKLLCISKTALKTLLISQMFFICSLNNFSTWFFFLLWMVIAINFFWEFIRDEPSVCTSQPSVFSHYESCYPKIISSRAFVLPIQQIFAISERTSWLADEVFDIVSTSFCNSNVQSFHAIHLFSFHPFICW